MRIVFVVPPVDYGVGPGPVDRVYGCNYAYDLKPPIHFLTLATVVRNLGHEVTFLDCPAEGIAGRDFEAMAARNLWDVAFFQCVYLSIPEDSRAARTLVEIAQKQGHTPPILIFEGTGPSWKPEEFHLHERCYILFGEPEITTQELLATLQTGGSPHGIAGLGFWEGGTFHQGPFRPLLDVNDLPIPDRRMLKGKYWLNRIETRPITTLYTSRGCGYRCTFCTPNAIDQGIELEFKKLQDTYVERPPLRQRRPELVIEEFRQVKEMGYKAVEVCDNLFIFDRRRTLEICRGLEGMGLIWLCLSRAPMLHDEEVVSAMARAGCKMIYIGSESFDQTILDDVHKDLKVSDVSRAVDTCRKYGIMPEVSVMMGGSALETKETIRTSVEKATRLGTDFVHFSIALPTPSTELYDQARKEGWFVDGDFHPVDNGRTSIINLPHLSKDDLEHELKRALARQYLSPAGILKQVSRVRTPADVIQKARAAGKLVRYLIKGTPLRSSN